MKHLSLLRAFGQRALTGVLFLFIFINSRAGTSQDLKQLSAKLPLVFTENRGQVVDEIGHACNGVLFKCVMDNLTIYVTEQGVSYVIVSPAGAEVTTPENPAKSETTLNYVRFDAALIGAHISKQQLEYTSPSLYASSYYTGSNKNGIRGVRNFSSLTIKNIYPGIDWHWHINEQNKPEYDFKVSPNANASLIKMLYKWADLEANETATQLRIKTPLGTLIEGEVKSYCDKKAVATNYGINKADNVVTFDVGSYNHNSTLVIDPPLALQWSLLYGTYFLNGFRGVAVDTFGRIVVTGYTTDPYFPLVNPGNGAYFQGTLGSGMATDIAIIKLTPAATTLWATYYGGASIDYGDAICTDGNNQIYVTGETKSANFPLQNGPAGSYNQAQSNSQYSDAFILKFDASGNRLWATCYGAVGDDEGMSLGTDGANNLYMVGYSSSLLPLQNPGGGAYFQPNLSGGSDVLIAKFTSSGAMQWATLYGGSSQDYGVSLTLNASGTLYIGGYTSSPNFPMQGSGGFQQNSYRGGSSDGFIAKFSSTGVRSWSTFLAGNSDDYVTGLDVGSLDQLLVTGRTASTNFPTLNDTHYTCSPYFQPANAGGYDAFVTRFDFFNNLSYSSYYGGNGTDGGSSIAADQYSNFFITGYTNSTDFPLPVMLSGAYYNDTLGLPYSAFMVGMKDTGSCPIWSTYAPPGFEYGNSVVADLQHEGNVYLAGEGDIFNDTIGSLDTLGQWPASGSTVGNAGAAVAGFGGFGGGGGGGGSSGGGGGGGGGNHCLIVTTIIDNIGCGATCNASAHVVVNGGTAPYRYLWNTGDTTAIVSNLCEGSYVVYVVDQNNCHGTGYVDIFPMHVDILELTDETCLGATHDGRISLNTFYGHPPYTYNWNNSQPVTSASFQNGLTSGQYDVAVSDALGCQIVIPFAIGGGEVVSVPGYLQCVNGGVELTADKNNQSPNPDYTYQWSTGETTFHIIAATSGVYSVSITNTQGCHSDLDIMVTYPLFNVSLSLLSPLCFADTTGAITTAINNCFFCDTSFSYHWQTGQTGSAIYNLTAGAYSVTVSNWIGCNLVIDTILAQPSLLQATAIGTQPLCNGDNSGYIIVNSSGGVGSGYNYSWSHNVVLNADSAGGLQAGQYVVSVSDINGCMDTALANLSNPDALTLSLLHTNIKCFGDSTGTITALASGGTGGYNYNWTGLNTHDSVLINLTAGFYYLQLQDANGCHASDSALITQPQRRLSIDSVNILSGINCSLSNNASISVSASGGSGLYTYNVSGLFGTITQANPLFTNVGAGADTVTITDSAGCMVDAAFYIDTFVKSVYMLEVDSVSCAGGSDGQLRLTAQPISRYPFSFAVDAAPAQFYNVFDNLPAGIHLLAVTDVNGCTDTLSFEIFSPAALDTMVWLNNHLLPVDTINIDNRTIAAFTKTSDLRWGATFAPPLNMVVNSDTAIVIQPQQTTFYTVVLYTGKNEQCRVTYTGQINVSKLPEFSTIITPNGDGYNDKFEINLSKYPNSELIIFDRWGEIVFKSEAYINDWSGVNQKTGKNLADGAYYYILKPSDSLAGVIKGNINITNSTH